jgi:hypothetical protein
VTVFNCQVVRLMLKLEASNHQQEIKKHPPNSASGNDRVSYDEIDNIPNEDLLVLFQQCIDSGDAPGAWLTTIIIGILKIGKPANNPESYHLVGLESCLLKMVTLLIAKRIHNWVQENDLLPPSQNGFREGYRTNNNAFILRCAIDKAHAINKTLFVAFVDFSNAFPWTDHATLWLKLYHSGVGGPLFDWICILYDCLRYQVSMDEEVSEEFRSMIGILTGDSASPDLWTFFLEDFRPPSDEDDIILGGTAIRNLEQADDMVLFSLSAAGLQKKLDYVWHYGSVNFLLVNIVKTLAMIFGPIPKDIFSFHFDGRPIKFTD